MKSLILLAFACLATARPLRFEQQALQITVRVLNPARVTGLIVQEAQKSAAATFAHAGVGIQWVDCETSRACDSDLNPAELWLHLLAGRPARFSTDALGFTLLTHEPNNDGGYAAVSWPAVRRLSSSAKIDASVVLGAAIAHELGHLLLGCQSHSRDGLMAPRLAVGPLGASSRGSLGFDTTQSAAIRAEIQRRTQGK